jgi:RNA polymerase sigma-70 factor (ECF subfamily)
MSTMRDASFTVEDLLSQGSWAERLARRLADPRAEAEDLVQEGWLAALRARPAAREGLRPWLGQVLRHAASNRRRGERRRLAREEQVGAAVAGAGVPSPEDLVARMEIQRSLADLVLALEAPVRQVILLRYYEGLTSGEIARALEQPESTVRWRLKTGVDELRRKLDERHGGQREAWLRGLVPLLGREAGRERGAEAAAGASPSPGAGVPTGVLALGATAIVLLAVGWVAVRSLHGRKPSATPLARVAPEMAPTDLARAAGGADPGGGPTGHQPALAAVAGDDLPGCQRRLAAMRGQIAAAEPELVAEAQGKSLFEFGEPNPVAEAALAAPLARIMKGDGSAPDYRLECRTWACRMTVLEPREVPNQWQAPLQRDQEMRERVRGTGFSAGEPVKDPVSGVPFEQKPVFLKLADPSGRRVPFAGPGMGPPPAPVKAAAARLPSTLAACRAELSVAEQRFGRMKAAIERDMRLDKLWPRPALNPALTKQVEADVKQSLAALPGPPAAKVECRGQICRIELDRQAAPDPNALHRALEKAPFRGHTERAMMGSWIEYYEVAPANAAVGMDLARKIRDELLASPDLAACESKHAPAGRIELMIEVPRTGEANRDGEQSKIATRVAGALGGTPFARCLEAALAPIVARTPVPARVTGGSLFPRLDFPRPAPPPARK